MDESLDLVKFKWDAGVYDLSDMCILVDNHIITEEDFHTITRYNYYAVKECGKED